MITFDLFGEIGWDITMNDMKNIVNSNKDEDLHFRISSLGGDINDGLVIHDLIKLHKRKTKSSILGLTASAGTIIGIGSDETEMSQYALFLIHNAWTFAVGNAEELEKVQDDLKKIDDIMVNIYVNKTGKSEDEIRDLMSQEVWLNAEEAKEMGFVDTIIPGEEMKIAANFRLLPNDELINKLKTKMSLFQKNKAKKLHIVALKDGSQILASEDTLAVGTEVHPVGDAELNDGDLELEDGNTATIENGEVTEVKEGEQEPDTVDVEALEARIIETVSNTMTEILSEFKQEIDAKIQNIRKTPSQGLVPKKQPVSNKIDDQKSDDVGERIRARNKANFAKLKEKREA